MCRLREGGKGILDAALCGERHRSSRIQKLHVSIRIEPYADNLLVLRGGNRQIPVHHDLAVVGHGTRVVYDDRDWLGRAFDSADHLRDLRRRLYGHRLGNPESVAGLERVRPCVTTTVVAVPAVLASTATLE